MIEVHWSILLLSMLGGGVLGYLIGAVRAMVVFYRVVDAEIESGRQNQKA